MVYIYVIAYEFLYVIAAKAMLDGSLAVLKMCKLLFHQWLNFFTIEYVNFKNREEAAIRELLTVTKDTRVGGSASGAHLHIVHLSDSTSSLDLIKVNIFNKRQHLHF